VFNYPFGRTNADALTGKFTISQLLSFQRQEEILDIHLASPQKAAQAVKPACGYYVKRRFFE